MLVYRGEQPHEATTGKTGVTELSLPSHPSALLVFGSSFLSGSFHALPQDLLQRAFLLQSLRSDSRAVCLHSIGQGSISGQCLLNPLSSGLQNFPPLNTENFQVPKCRLLHRASLL